MPNLTVSKIAKIVGISPSTVRFWLDESRSPGEHIARFFSEGSRPAPGETRQFTEDDLQTYITIKTLSDNGVPFPEIAERLKAGEIAEPISDRELPGTDRDSESRSPENLPATMADTAVINSLRDLLGRIEDRTVRAEDRRIEAERKAASADTRVSVLEQTVVELRSELAELRRRYEAERTARERAEFELAEYQRGAIGRLFRR